METRCQEGARRMFPPAALALPTMHLPAVRDRGALAGAAMGAMGALVTPLPPQAKTGQLELALMGS